ncbi:DUF523 domain-containing protein [Oceanirhabdus sp. W0125-5]|uniref:DUF523 domain-containing protein n=1 Tax=Oceanirhabdus sp. W0125-5 TaxID=2999116 RepID=UPI0022F34435|nr:DUF523 domain-containing protein [Oceanirhabdus sp. W0125-5]WBW99416.1 DUF523 domain-containing protein [Oceanirhabdus sp. W0125-5]
MKIILSACLCGINCKYDGGNNLNEKALELLKSGKAVPVCPEQLGGQSTPRIPHEIIHSTGEEVLDGRGVIKGPEGDDVTDEFLKGAQETLKIAQSIGAEYAVLKARSPSCGFGMIYDGSFSGEKKEGNGVTAALLNRHGIKIFTEENIDELLKEVEN